MELIDIGTLKIGKGYPCFIIAEMGLSHEGSLGAAMAFIDASAEAGADAVKFQTHIAGHESTKKEQFRAKVFLQDKTRQDYWKRTAFSEPQWKQLKEYAEEKELVFLSSPFSVKAVKMLDKMGVKAWKIASGEVNNIPMLEEIAKTKKPVLMSSGMSFIDELDESVNLLKRKKIPVVLFQCTNRYPCPPEHLGLNLIPEFSGRYSIPIGFSDHSGETSSGIAALCLGACSIEVHVIFSKKCFGPDVSASLTFEQLSDLVRGIRFLEKSLNSPLSKDKESDSLEDIRKLFTKSIVPAKDVPKGTKLTRAHLAFKKPGTGIPAKSIQSVLGRMARKKLRKDELFSLKDLIHE